MRRRRYRTQYNQKNNKILLAEFLFYNKTKKVISTDVINKIKEKLLDDKNEVEKIYWSNKVFSKNGLGFIFTVKGTENKEIYIDMKNYDEEFDYKEYNKCVSIINKSLFLGFKPTEDQVCILERIFQNNIYFSTPIKFPKKIYNTWNDIITDLIITKNISKYKKENSWGDFCEDIKTLLDYKLPEHEPDYHIYNSYSSSCDVKHIIKVIEKRINEKNYRIALCSSLNRYDADYYIDVFCEDDYNVYTNIDENKIFFIVGKKNYFLDLELVEYTNSKEEVRRDGIWKNEIVKKIIINKKLISMISSDIDSLLSGDQIVINRQIYEFYKTRINYDEDEKTFLTEREEAIHAQYKKLLREGKKVKIGGVIISKTSIQVDDNFLMEFDETFLDVIDKFDKIKKTFTISDARFNFNELYNELVSVSVLKIIDRDNTRMNDYKNFKYASFKLNGMKIEISKETTRVKINNVFCRIDDIQYILSKAICYNNIEEFNKYIKDVSYIGAEWKKLISTGVLLELNNPLRNAFDLYKEQDEHSDGKIFLRFSLLWDTIKRNQIYLLLNNQKYLIKQKAKFKKHFNYPKKVTNITQLKTQLNECIENLDDDKMIEIIENGVEEAKIIQQRGEELVKQTISNIMAKECELQIRGKTHYGYLLKGKITKNDYFITKSDLSVFKKQDGSWNRRCVVDDHTKNRIYEDRLANRLINIYNEPEKIYTLHN